MFHTRGKPREPQGELQLLRPVEPLESFVTSETAVPTPQTSTQMAPPSAHVSHSETEEEGEDGSPASGKGMRCCALTPVPEGPHTMGPAVWLQMQGGKYGQLTSSSQLPTLGGMNKMAAGIKTSLTSAISVAMAEVRSDINKLTIRMDEAAAAGERYGNNVTTA